MLKNHHKRKLTLPSMAVNFVEIVIFLLIFSSEARFGNANLNMRLPNSVADFLDSGTDNIYNFLSDMMEYTMSQILILIVDNNTVETSLMPLLSPKSYQENYIWKLILNPNSTHLLQDPNMEPSLIIFLCSYGTVVNTMKWIMNSTELLHKYSWIAINNNDEFRTLELPDISPALTFFVVNFASKNKHDKLFPEVRRYDITYLYKDFNYGRQRISKIGYWSKADGLKMRKRFSECCYNVSGYFIRAVWIEHLYDAELANVVNLTNIDINNINRIGFAGEIFRIVIEKLKLRTETYEVPDGKFGDYEPEKKTAYGIFRELQQQKADIAIGTLIDTIRRRHVADFSTKIYESNIGVIYPKLKFIEHFYFYVKPFTVKSWLLVSFGCVLALLAGTCLRRFSKNNVEWNMLNTWATFVNQGADLNNANFVMSFYQLSLYFTIGLLATFYSSKLIAMTAVTFQSPPFTSMKNLAEQDVYFPVLSYGSSVVQDIMVSTDEEMIGIQTKLKSDYELHVLNISRFDIMNKVAKERIAYIGSAEMLYMIKQNNENFEIMEERYFESGTHLAYRKEFPLRKIIDKLLTHLRQSGIIDRILNKYFKKKKTPEENNVKQVQFEDIYVPLLVILFGNVVALTVNGIRYLERKRRPVNMEDEEN